MITRENKNAENQVHQTSVMIIAEKGDLTEDLGLNLTARGYACSIISGDPDDILDRIYETNPDILLIVSGKLPWLARRVKEEKPLPIIGLLDNYASSAIVAHASINDFIMAPYPIGELDTRIKRLLNVAPTNSDELMSIGDLAIDQARCEVSVGEKLVSLTFKEYELLKFLVTNKGRVFTRESLLDKVWGFDYFGGDRTVDVHVRRLRSKIEDAEHSFIETVRGIGYRFKDED